jgi:hypothetical protein
MNLLTLQICKEEAEKMIKDPHAWIGNYRNLRPEAATAIVNQGRRTLEVISAYEKTRKIPRRMKRPLE